MPPRSGVPDFNSRFAALREQLACPVCHGELQEQAESLLCLSCSRTYPVIDGIPVLIPAP